MENRCCHQPVSMNQEKVLNHPLQRVLRTMGHRYEAAN